MQVVNAAEILPLINPSDAPDTAAKPISLNCSSSISPSFMRCSIALYISGATLRTIVIVAAVNPA